jgi:hypothetical protein
MIGPEAFAAAVSLRASSVLSRRRTQTEGFSIGPLSFQLTAPVAQPEEQWLGRAFLKASKGNAIVSATPHRVFAWDGIERDELPPPPPWEPTAPEPLGLVGSHSNETIRCAVDIQTDSLMVSDFERNTSHNWYPNISQLPPWAKASPFRIVLSWLCNRFHMQIVHGAALAIAGRAVLLAGAGGSGKSTTALACALAGFEYLGDDYCAVEPKAGKVHMVYRTAKLFGPSLEMIPHLADWVDNRDRIDDEKGVIFLEPDDVRLARSAELTAILMPRVANERLTTIETATRDQAIKAILPSTIGGLMGGTSITPRLILELVRSVPAYHLVLGTDIAAVTDVVASRVMAE